jgi:hypothetical protein
MKRKILIIAAAAMLAFPGVLAAQSQHGAMMGSGQHMMMGHGMMQNLGTMADMMKEMHQMMGHLTPDQQKEMLKLMHQMGGIMQQMHGPKAAQMQQVHREQLQRMQEQLQLMKTKMKKQ